MTYKKFNSDRVSILNNSNLAIAKWLLEREVPKKPFIRTSKKGKCISNRICKVCGTGPVQDRRRTWNGVHNQYVHSSCANKN
jgi:hypothetical protein